LVWCAADLFTSASISCIFMPVAAIAYSMMGLPQVAFPFLLLNFWMTSLASEAMLSFLTKFSTNPTSSMIVCQIALVNLQVFGGGLFIPWKGFITLYYLIYEEDSNVNASASRLS
jgi:hypothetical protein